MRLVKSPMELRIMQHAIDISIEAHQRAWAAAGNAKWEYEVDAEVAYTFKLRNADNWGYPDIVGCGPNATTLHYNESQGPVKPGELLLMDVGAEYDHYTADITRTFPVNGKFTPDSGRALSDCLRRAGSSCESVEARRDVVRCKSGRNGSDQGRAVEAWPDYGSQFEQYRIWFMHGTSHWLGMNVHDVGGGAKFEPGMVFTNEPGIYVRLDALDNMPGWNAGRLGEIQDCRASGV